MGMFVKDNKEKAIKVVKKYKDLDEETANAFVEIVKFTGDVNKETELKLKDLAEVFTGNNTQDMIIAENLILIGLLDRLVNKK